jgi:arginine/ornithine transport system permease protein
MTTYFLNILQGLFVTIGVALGALVVAAVLGLAGAAAKLSPYKSLNWIGDIYSTVIRGVPDLVWMLLLYFGGQILVNDIAEALGYRNGPQINPFVAGVLTIGFVSART